MKRIGQMIVVCVLSLSLMTGCWNRRELDELGILSGVAIDRAGKDYQVAAQVIIPDQVNSRTGGGKAPVTLYKAKGATLFEAFRNLTTTSPRKIYTAHIQTLVLSEEVAHEGVAKVLDLLVRNQETRMNYVVMVAKQVPAEQIMNVLTPLEKVPADSLFNSLETSSNIWSPVSKITVDMLMDQLTTEGIHPVLPGVTTTGNAPASQAATKEEIDVPVKLVLSELAVFKGDKLAGWLSPSEARGYNYITDKVKSSVGHLKCPDGKLLAIEIIRTKTKLKCMLVNGEPVIEVLVETDSNIGEETCNLDISSPVTIKELEQNAEIRANTLMKKSVDTMQQKYKIDIFGFGNLIYKTHPKLWKTLEKDWDEHFSKLQVIYKTKMHIRNTGMTSNSLTRIMKE
ncbi:Ger(x)C family spore germination protein [Paenibacillus paeoniae]|uniref:Ger(X)C family spore germination protein n=1 Tax=Paenibacillus paeoniae TaxID=2292705 RepID=A0A371PKW7_9BACL|nr:Ger(x)C family spore germination protein [Paenibacillus paeoniae]REK76846.1 Ger(x)C family spore germination protein [Paenibacillus paeoniae]